MAKGWRTLGLCLVLGATPVLAVSAKTDLHGMALGMTMDRAMASAGLPCTKQPFSGDVTCHDAGDGSDYTASFSAGEPSVILTVAHSFCTHDAPEAVLKQSLVSLGVAQTGVENDPNGFHADLDPKTEAILNADDGTCPDSRGKHYILSLRSNALITTESSKAVERAKRSLR